MDDFLEWFMGKRIWRRCRRYREDLNKDPGTGGGGQVLEYSHNTAPGTPSCCLLFKPVFLSKGALRARQAETTIMLPPDAESND